MLGQVPSGDPSDNTGDASALIAYTADALTQFVVMRNLQREVRDFLGLDMFSVRTKALQNVLYRGFGLNQFSDDQNIRAGNYFDDTTVFLGKYIGADIFVESMFSWRYDPARQEWGGMRMEPELGLEMRNPLFDVRLNMNPLHSENWFINDITFSLVWRKSL
jgi:hypothetical protein